MVGIALLTSVFALYYYAGPIKAMYFAKEDSPYKFGLASPVVLVVFICLIGVILFGVYPEPVMRLAENISSSWGFAAR
jgi:NADH:ubiquinone oxidoreductase subunit 2 (subunit N)